MSVLRSHNNKTRGGWVGSVQPECTGPLGTLSWMLNGKRPSTQTGLIGLPCDRACNSNITADSSKVKNNSPQFNVSLRFIRVFIHRVTIFQGRRGRVSFRCSINKSAVVWQNEERLPVKWSSFLSGRFRSTFWPYLCHIFAIWRENQTGEIKVRSKGIRDCISSRKFWQCSEELLFCSPQRRRRKSNWYDRQISYFYIFTVWALKNNQTLIWWSTVFDHFQGEFLRT